MSPFAVSVSVGLCSVLIDLPLALALGYWFSRKVTKRLAIVRGVIEVLVFLPMVLPPVATGMILMNVFDQRSLGGQLWLGLGFNPYLLSYAAAVSAGAVVGFPFLVKSSQLGFAQVPPRVLLVWRLYRRSPWQIWCFCIWPYARSGILAGCGLCFARVLGEFGATMIVAGNIPGKTQTLSLGLYASLLSGDEGLAWNYATQSIILAVFSFCFIALCERRWGKRGHRDWGNQ